MSKITPIPFYYVRHGQTDWNLENRAMGITDIPLNQHGINQAKNARGLLANAGINTICCSPLMRAKMTAEIFNETLNCEMVVIEELHEFNLGTYAGQIIGAWFDDWMKGAPLPGGELYADFRERCAIGVNKALNRKGLTLIIAHGGVFWSIEHALNTRLNQDLPNCVPAFHIPPVSENESWKISLVNEPVQNTIIN